MIIIWEWRNVDNPLDTESFTCGSNHKQSPFVSLSIVNFIPVQWMRTLAMVRQNGKWMRTLAMARQNGKFGTVTGVFQLFRTSSPSVLGTLTRVQVLQKIWKREWKLSRVFCLPLHWPFPSPPGLLYWCCSSFIHGNALTVFSRRWFFLEDGEDNMTST